jgi:hypothetical protein
LSDEQMGRLNPAIFLDTSGLIQYKWNWRNVCAYDRADGLGRKEVVSRHQAIVPAKWVFAMAVTIINCENQLFLEGGLSCTKNWSSRCLLFWRWAWR